MEFGPHHVDIHRFFFLGPNADCLECNKNFLEPGNIKQVSKIQ